jgi:dihydroorotate dehydrogenase electron transfer subunit
MDNFYVLPIKKVISENPKIKTFCFSHSLNSKPGQFVMLWIPGVGQKPFSVGYDDGNEFRLTVFQRGQLTTKLFALQTGDSVGIAGPYGTNFTLRSSTHYIMVAGGYGVVPLKFLAEQVSRLANTAVDFCLGASNQEALIFAKSLPELAGLQLQIATDDGSAGHYGYVTDLLPSLLESRQKKIVAVCGPELMEKTVLDICNHYKTPCEISVERYIKCGVGICGQCAVDGLGICLCKEGPVVSRRVANQITEFGRYARDNGGLKHYFRGDVGDKK